MAIKRATTNATIGIHHVVKKQLAMTEIYTNNVPMPEENIR